MQKCKKITRTRRCGALVIGALTLGGITTAANASLVLTGYTESTTSFAATYAFTPDISPSTVPPPGSAWQASLSQTYTPTGFGTGYFDFIWSGQHLPSGAPAGDTCSFSNSVLTGTPCSQTANAVDGTASDMYGFTVNLVSGGGTVTFTGAHTSAVPLPAAAWLLVSGLMGLTVVTRRRLTADAIA